MVPLTCLERILNKNLIPGYRSSKKFSIYQTAVEKKPRRSGMPVSGKGWGAWIRTKIHSSKGWCAALAPRPSASHIVSQRLVMGNTCTVRRYGVSLGRLEGTGVLQGTR